MVLDTLPEMAGAVALYRAYGFVETAPYWDYPVERTVYLEKRRSARERLRTLGHRVARTRHQGLARVAIDDPEPDALERGGRP